MSSVQALLASEDLVEGFPPAVEAEAAGLASAGLPDGLRDLRALPFVTIDEPHSRDLDQALLVEADGDGHVVWYAIAHAAAFVRRGTALWDEALRRGASFYVPGLTVPMLPRVLSEGAVSLLPDVDRAALAFRMRLDAEGACVATTLEPARIRSRAKLSYAGVQRFYDGVERVEEPIASSLRALAVVGRRRVELAAERDVVRFQRREIEVGLAADGLRFVATEDLRLDVERWNEQVSVLCNVEGARWLRHAAGTALPIYRVHPPPEPSRVRELAATIREIVRAQGLPEEWVWGREPLADYLARLPVDGPHARVAEAIHRQAVVSNGEATYRAAPGGHHGLGAEVYARFTAPMREVVGVWLHQEVAAPSGDEALRDRVIAAAEEAHDRQRRLDRAVNRLVLDQVLGDALVAGVQLPATVMGVTPAKVHVRLDDPPIDVKVYVEHLGAGLRADRAALWRDGVAVVRTGDAVRVRVIGRDVGRDRWQLALGDRGAPVTAPVR